MVNTETMDSATPSPLLESSTPRAYDTEVGVEQKDNVSISLTAAFLYGACCLIFILVVIFLFVCKIGLIDSDPANRSTSTRWVRGKQRQFLGGTC